MLDNRVRMTPPPWKYTNYDGVAFTPSHPSTIDFICLSFCTGRDIVRGYFNELLGALPYSRTKNDFVWKVSKYRYSLKPGGAIIGTV